MAAAQHQIERGPRADKTRRALRATRTRQEAERQFGQAESRVGERSPVVRGECNFKAAAKRRAAYRRDDWLATRFNLVADDRQRRRQRRLAELLDVRAANEVAPCSQQQYGVDAGVLFGGFDGVAECATHGHAERIDGGIVDSNDKNAIVQLTSDDVSCRFGSHAPRLHLFRDCSMRGTR
jgi:hypothetical protein